MNSYIIFCFGNVNGLNDELSPFYHGKAPYLDDDNAQIMIATFQSEASLVDIANGISKDKVFFLFEINDMNILKYNLHDEDFVRVLFEDMIKAQHDKHEEVDEVKAFKLDEILDKIRLSGIDSLTVDEKNFLDNHNS